MALKVSLTFTDGSLVITKDAPIDTRRPEEYATHFRIAVKNVSENMLAAIRGVYGDAILDDDLSPAGQYCIELEDMAGLRAVRLLGE